VLLTYCTSMTGHLACSFSDLKTSAETVGTPPRSSLPTHATVSANISDLLSAVRATTQEVTGRFCTPRGNLQDDRMESGRAALCVVIHDQNYAF
jgi:hypothetical protein